MRSFTSIQVYAFGFILYELVRRQVMAFVVGPGDVPQADQEGFYLGAFFGLILSALCFCIYIGTVAWPAFFDYITKNTQEETQEERDARDEQARADQLQRDKEQLERDSLPKPE